MKDEFGGAIIDQFIGLQSKMYSIKKINCSESGTTKGVNMVTEFNEFKDVLFNKKVIRHKMKRIQAKKHKIELMKLIKHLYCALMIKDMCQMMVLILQLIFIKIVKNVIRSMIKIKINDKNKDQ